MKIAITGSEGFIGTHVRRLLTERGETDHVRIDMMEPRVHGSAPYKDVSRGLRSPVYPEGVHVVLAGSYTGARLIGASDVLIHLAAQVGVADSMDDPARYVVDNTDDTHDLFTALARSPTRPKRVVVASSMSVYGDPETPDPISETHPIRPASVYGLTKFDQEATALLWGQALGIDVVALRFFNVYGPGQALTNPYTGVLAIFASAFLEGRAPTIYEDGLQTRDFIYVEDVADVVTRAALGEIPSGVYNVCTGQATSVLGVALMLGRLLGDDPEINVTGIERAGDIRHCVGDPSKLLLTCPEFDPRSFDAGVVRYADALKALETAKGA